ncbi:PepSY domain-containing protein [Methyloraptor flagellatus]|uniref:PepSY-associated TM helix domain-containing protein n=1 Tax=Methyloraptor flagellatus TaxID=3162530 RepID=A0AAU7XC46_9HYPH
MATPRGGDRRPRHRAGLGPYTVSETTRWLTNLHRSFLVGDAGRVAAGLGALAMLALSVSGLVLLARSLGGWRALARPIRGSALRRWHGELGRLAAAGLVLSSLTGLWMSADRFGLLPESECGPRRDPDRRPGHAGRRARRIGRDRQHGSAQPELSRQGRSD